MSTCPCWLRSSTSRRRPSDGTCSRCTSRACCAAPTAARCPNRPASKCPSGTRHPAAPGETRDRRSQRPSWSRDGEVVGMTGGTDGHRGGTGAGRSPGPDRGHQCAQHRRRIGCATEHPAGRGRRQRPACVLRVGRPRRRDDDRAVPPRRRVRRHRRLHDHRRLHHPRRDGGAHRSRVHPAGGTHRGDLADSSKIGKVTFARICGPEAIDTLVTDAGIEPATCGPQRKSAHMEVIVAPRAALHVRHAS